MPQFQDTGTKKKDAEFQRFKARPMDTTNHSEEEADNPLPCTKKKPRKKKKTTATLRPSETQQKKREGRENNIKGGGQLRGDDCPKAEGRSGIKRHSRVWMGCCA